MNDFIGQLVEHGTTGLLAGLMLFLYWNKDKDLTTERAARIADAKDFTKLALDLQNRVMDATNKLSDVFDAIRKEKS